MMRQFQQREGKRISVIEGNRACNRHCSYCAVPDQYNSEQELTTVETFQVIDWLYGQKYRLLSFLGGEPLAEFPTKEGITFFEHTRQTVNYASNKGMVVNVTSNGDFLTADKIQALKKAGLDTLSLSLHSYTTAGLDNLIRGAKLAAETGIIPVIHSVLTIETADKLPGIAARIAENGVLFGVCIAQTKGGEFSSANKRLTPTPDQQKRVLKALLRLKTFGFVRNNRKYLSDAPSFYPDAWKCNPKIDPSIHIGAGGRVSVCTEIRTDLRVAEISSLGEQDWRDTKHTLVEKCEGCLYNCYYEAQNPDLIGDIPMTAVALLIRTGNSQLAEKWGRYAVTRIKQSDRNTDWGIKLT